MVQAAVGGFVDFRQSKRYDPKWHQFLRLVLDGLSRQNRRELKSLLYSQAVAVYTSRRIKAEQMDEIAQKVSDLYHDIHESLYPHEKNLRTQYEKQMVKQDIRGWEARFGSMSEEETKKKIDEFAAAMERLRHDTAAKMRSQAANQLGYMGRELGINPTAKKKPGKGRK
jgi:BMFP domain-containing protein YqiC